MKLIRFYRHGQSEPQVGVVRKGGIVDIRHTAQALGRSLPVNDVLSCLTYDSVREEYERLAEEGEARGFIVKENLITVLPPIAKPSKFLCIGKNSQQHREELVANNLLKETPTEPTGFIKLVSTLVGDGSSVVRPEGITTLDYEPELVFVVGRNAHGVKRDDAASHLVGLTLFNDLTAREIQKREVASGTKFWTAKNMPGFAPIGPYVATLDEVADPFDLWVTCHVNGELRLRESTSQYIYKIGDVIEHFSRFMPFEPGDLIAMGAPKGTAVGHSNASELYLRPGDLVEIAIEGLMALRTHIVAN